MNSIKAKQGPISLSEVKTQNFPSLQSFLHVAKNQLWKFEANWTSSKWGFGHTKLQRKNKTHAHNSFRIESRKMSSFPTNYTRCLKIFDRLRQTHLEVNKGVGHKRIRRYVHTYLPTVTRTTLYALTVVRTYFFKLSQYQLMKTEAQN